MALIAIGLGAAWRRLRWAGLLPLAFNLGYALANGVARFSGWRYDLPVDWVPYFYFGIGAVELLGAAAVSLGAKANRLFTPPVSDRDLSALGQPWPPGWKMGLVTAAFLLVGWLPWALEAAIPPHFDNLSKEAVLSQVAGLESMRAAGIDLPQIQAFSAQPDSGVVLGRLLYPRFYRRNLGMAAAHPWAAYAVRDFPRLGFIVINRDVTQAVLPSREIPADFPNGADVIVLGCQRQGYLEAKSVSFLASDHTYFNGSLADSCSP
jgi:hypothetical protein